MPPYAQQYSIFPLFSVHAVMHLIVTLQIGANVYRSGMRELVLPSLRFQNRVNVTRSKKNRNKEKLKKKKD